MQVVPHGFLDLDMIALGPIPFSAAFNYALV
jgi:hypothetical protein